MLHHLKRMMPNSWKHELKKALIQLKYMLSGYEYQCNICQWRDRRFNDDGWHDSTRCPNCGSSVRHRLLWAIVSYSDEFNMNRLFTGKAVLHIAPERYFRRHLATRCQEYRTADACAPGYEQKFKTVDEILDIAHMPSIADERFDCVIALDVLEHVPDHLSAMAEMYRILRKDGYCILTVPQPDHLLETYEDPAITDPDARKNAYGQENHLRLYGDDLAEMLQQQGFMVTVANEQFLPAALVKRHILFPPVLSTHPLATNYRKIYFGKKA